MAFGASLLWPAHCKTRQPSLLCAAYFYMPAIDMTTWCVILISPKYWCFKKGLVADV